ncbi:MAG TPA: hypothetical protein VIR03_00945 [Candidatus Saccharimonadales bacterium]
MTDDKGDLKMNETEKRELALSEVVVLILSIIGMGVVIWLGWFAG